MQEKFVGLQGWFQAKIKKPFFGPYPTLFSEDSKGDTAVSGLSYSSRLPFSAKGLRQHGYFFYHLIEPYKPI